MNRLISLAVLLTLLSLAFTQKPLQQPSQVIEIFRHGARGPLSGYDKSWPFSLWGHLTPAGKRQQYVLGKFNSEKYPHLLGPSANHSEIYMLSDVTKRCIESAEIQLAGMYGGKVPSLKGTHPVETAIPPFNGSEILKAAADVDQMPINSNGHIPVAVQVVNETQLGLFKRTHGTQCPNGGNWERENAFDAESKNAWKIFQDTFDAVNKYFPPKKQLKTGFGVAIFGDALLVNVFDHQRNLSSFGIEDPELERNFTYAYSWFVFHREYGQQIQKQLSAFPLIDEMLQQLEAFKKGEENHKKAALYSAHDYNIYAVLAAFGVISEECIMANFLSSIANETLPYPHCHFPFFASNLMIELYNQTDSNVTSAYIKMLYNDAPLALCNGKDVCEYNEFVALARSATGNNTYQTYRQKCGVKEPKVQDKKTPDINLNITKKDIDIDLNITQEEKKLNIDLNITESTDMDFLGIPDIIEKPKKELNIDMDITENTDMGFLGIPDIIEKPKKELNIDMNITDEESLKEEDSDVGISKIDDADLAQFATINSNQGNQDTTIKLLVAATLMVAMVALIVIIIKKSSAKSNKGSPKKHGRYDKLTEIKIH